MNPLINNHSVTQNLTASTAIGTPLLSQSTSYNLYYDQKVGVKTGFLSKTQIKSLHHVRVVNELLANIIKFREQNTKYQTGKLLKSFAFYLNLKSLTTSGIIKNITRPTPEMLKICNCSARTFATRVGDIILSGFALKNSKNLVLTSVNKLMEQYECFVTEWSEVFIPEGMHLHNVLEAHLLKLQQRKQEKQFNRNITKVKEVYDYIQMNLPRSKNLRETILQEQIKIFKYGHNDEFYTTVITKYNADNQIKARTIRDLFNLKSYKSVAYLKKRLVKKGLIEIEKRKIESDIRGRKKRCYVSYEQNSKTTTWHLCDKLSVSPALYR